MLHFQHYTANFVEGAGKSYPAGTNVAIVNTTGTTYKYDAFSGIVDLSSYSTIANTVSGVVAGTNANQIVVTKNGANSTITINNVTNATTAASCSGNATTATTLQTSRNINGTSFNGSSAITTANWGTARNISISDSDGTNTGTAVSVNGSQAYTLKLPATIKASITGNCTGSSGSCTGNANTATTATKLGSANVGSSTQPIYLNGGTATACGSSLAVSITGNAATATTAASCSGNANTANYLKSNSYAVGSAFQPVYFSQGIPQLATPLRHETGTLTSSGSFTVTLTDSQKIWKLTPTGVISSSTFTAPSGLTSSQVYTFEIIVTMGATEYSITWPSSVTHWLEGAAPTLSANSVTFLVFRTIDGGTTWVGNNQGSYSTVS